MISNGGNSRLPIFSKASVVTVSDTNTSGNVFNGLISHVGGKVAVDPLDSPTGAITMSLNTHVLLNLAVKRVLATGSDGFLTGFVIGLS